MPRRILIVEPDERIRSVLCRALQLQGVAADELPEQSQALPAIRSGRYSLILLDLTAGSSVLDAVRTKEPRPVIIVLSNGEDDVRRLAGESCVTLTINKKFAMSNMDPVIAAIAAVCRDA